MSLLAVPPVKSNSLSSMNNIRGKEVSQSLISSEVFLPLEIPPLYMDLNPIPEERESPHGSPVYQNFSSPKEKSPGHKSPPRIIVGGAEPNTTKHSIMENPNQIYTLQSTIDIQKNIFDFIMGTPDVDLDFQELLKHRLSINPKKTKYLNEKHLYLGDLVIVFPNPETVKYFTLTSKVNIEKAFNTYIKTFETDFPFVNKELNEIFFKAFFHSFENLNTSYSYDDNQNANPEQGVGKNSDQSPEKSPEKNPEQCPEMSPDISPQKSPDISPQKSPDISPQKSPEKIPKKGLLKSPRKNPKNSPKSQQKSPEKSPKKSPKKNPKKKTNPENELFFSHIIKNMESSQMESTSSLIKKRALTVDTKKNPPECQSPKRMRGFSAYSKEPRSAFKGKENASNMNHPASPSRRTALLREQNIIKTKSLKKELKKVIMTNRKIKKEDQQIGRLLAHGKFLEKNQPGDKSKNMWKQKKKKISDFFSLMRNAILYKISNEAGFKTRSFLSKKGDFIYTVLYSCDDNLKITAELDSFNKQVTLPFTDLLSLEPVDRKLRPIRYHTKLRENNIEDLDEKSENSNYFSFVKPLILKLLEDINYKKICRELQISGADDNFEILDDEKISDDLWKAYYEYLVFLKDGVLEYRAKFRYSDVTHFEKNRALRESQKNSHNKRWIDATDIKNMIPNSKIIKHNRRKILAKEYEELFGRALEVVNSQYKGRKILKTIWDYSKMVCQEAYFDYFQTQNSKSFQFKKKLEAIWKNYQITEKGHISLFSRMERLKLAYNTLQKFVNVAYCIDNKYISEIFVLNDMLALRGLQTKELLTLDASFQTLTTKALSIKRSSHIANFGKNAIAQNDTEENNKITTELKTEEEEIFETNEVVKQTYDNLLSEWKFKFSNPIYVPVEKIRNYYGEKVALYFQFLAHYTKYLSLMALLGLAKTVIFYLFNDTYFRFIMDIFICITLGIWSNAFVLRWGRKELSFAIKYGQLDFEQDEQERSLFQGTFKRSPVNDRMNVLSYSRARKWSTMTFAIIVSLIMIVINMIFVSLFFQLVVYFYKAKLFANLGWFRLDIGIPAFLNNVMNQIFDSIYKKIALKYTEYENHRTLSLFEMSYITKKYLFSLIIMITPLAFISFLNNFEVFGFECVDGCSFQLLIYMRTYYVFTLFTNVWEILKPGLDYAYNKFKNKSADTENANNALKTKQQTMLTSKMNASQMKSAMDRDKFIKEANNFLEKEYGKDDYSESQDIYGTVEDYMEICLNYALLALFGIGDPLVFCMAFLSMILEMQTDKFKLIEYTKRPIPLGERTIGIWIGLMEFVCNVSVLTNSGIISFTIYSLAGSDRVLLFVILILVSYSINWVLNSIFEDIPGRMARIMKRHKYLLEKTVQGIDKSALNPIQLNPAFPIFKIFNTKIIILGEDFFEDVNNLDYSKKDQGKAEARKLVALKIYRNQFRETYFKEFRWNPRMETKTPSVILQELEHKKKRKTVEFKETIKKLRKETMKTKKKSKESTHSTLKIEVSRLSKKKSQKKQNIENQKIKNQKIEEEKKAVIQKKEVKTDEKKEEKKNQDQTKKTQKLSNIIRQPSEFLLLPDRSKQQKKLEMERYLTFENKNKKDLLNQGDFYVDFSVNSNEFLIPNDLQTCLSTYSKRLIDSKRNQLPLIPWLRFHEIMILEKTIKNILDTFARSIVLHTRVSCFNNEQEVWIGYPQNYKELDLPMNFSIKISEVLENDHLSRQYIKIKKLHKILWGDNLDNLQKNYQNIFRIRSRFLFQNETFEFFDNDEESKSFHIEVCELGELKSSKSIEEFNLLDIIDIRSVYNAFYKDNEILFFIENFLQGLEQVSSQIPEISTEIQIKSILFKIVSKSEDIYYFMAGPDLNNCETLLEVDFKEIRANEYRNCGKTLINMICLNKLKIEWEDIDALGVSAILETFSQEYPKSIPIIGKLLNANEKNYTELSEELRNIIQKIPKEEKNKPEDWLFVKKLKSKPVTLDGESDMKPNDLIRTYTILGNNMKALDILKTIPEDERDENMWFYEVLNLSKTECPLKRLDGVSMEYLEKLRDLYGECDRKEIKIYYFLAQKAMELKQFKTAKEVYINKLWQILQVNCLEENKPAFLKFYELQGRILNDYDKPHDAIRSFEKMLSLSQDDLYCKARSLLLISIIKHQIGKPLQAINYLSQCWEIIHKSCDPNLVLVYGFLAFLYMKTGKTVKSSLFIGKSYKWMLKNGVSRDRKNILKMIEYCWIFSEFFAIFPQDVRRIILSAIHERVEKTKGDAILEAVDYLILCRIYCFHSSKRSFEMINLAQKALEISSPTFAGSDLKKKIYRNKFIYFIMELRIFLHLIHKDLEKHDELNKLFKEMKDQENELDFHDFHLKTMMVYNQNYLHFMNKDLKVAIDQLTVFVTNHKGELSLASKYLLYDFLGFLTALNGEDVSREHWAEMLDTYGLIEEMKLLGYLALSINLMLLKRFDKAAGFLEYLKMIIEQNTEGQIDDYIKLFDILVLLSICLFQKGDFVRAKSLLEKVYLLCEQYSKKKTHLIAKEKSNVMKFFRKHFEDRVRRSLLLSNLGKINAFLDDCDKAYFIFNKSFRILKKDLSHKEYTTQTEKKFDMSIIKQSNHKSSESNMTSSENESISKKLPPTKEEEIYNLCLESGNPSNLICTILNLVQMQIKSFKYVLALELLEKIERVLERLNDVVVESSLQNSNNIKLAGFFCKSLLIKVLFFVGNYERSAEKLKDLNQKLKLESSTKNDRDYSEKIGIYLFRQNSAFLNCRLYRDFHKGYKDSLFCFLENPKLFGEIDMSMFDVIEDMVRCYLKINKNTLDFVQDKNTSNNESTSFLKEIKESLEQMKNKYFNNPRIVALVCKINGNLEYLQKNFYDAKLIFKEGLEHTHKTSQIKHLKGFIILEKGKMFYKQLKLLKAEKTALKALKHFKKFSEKEICVWELFNIYYFLGKISINFYHMIEDNINILNKIPENEMGRWQKHYVEVKLWREDLNMLKIFEEYREKSILFFLIEKLKKTYDNDDNGSVINDYVHQLSFRNNKRLYKSIEYFEQALSNLKGKTNSKFEMHKKIEEKLIKLKYENKKEANKVNI